MWLKLNHRQLILCAHQGQLLQETEVYHVSEKFEVYPQVTVHQGR